MTGSAANITHTNEANLLAKLRMHTIRAVLPSPSAVIAMERIIALLALEAKKNIPILVNMADSLERLCAEMPGRVPNPYLLQNLGSCYKHGIGRDVNLTIAEKHYERVAFTKNELVQIRQSSEVKYEPPSRFDRPLYSAEMQPSAKQKLPTQHQAPKNAIAATPIPRQSTHGITGGNKQHAQAPRTPQKTATSSYTTKYTNGIINKGRTPGKTAVECPF